MCCTGIDMICTGGFHHILFCVQEIQLLVLCLIYHIYYFRSMDLAGAPPGRNEQATQAQGPYLFLVEHLYIIGLHFTVDIISLHCRYNFMYMLFDFTARSWRFQQLQNLAACCRLASSRRHHGGAWRRHISCASACSLSCYGLWTHSANRVQSLALIILQFKKQTSSSASWWSYTEQ